MSTNGTAPHSDDDEPRYSLWATNEEHEALSARVDANHAAVLARLDSMDRYQRSMRLLVKMCIPSLLAFGLAHWSTLAGWLGL